MFGTLCKLSRSFNTARDFFWAAMIWGSRAAERPILMIAPRSFSTFAHKTSKKLWRRNGVPRFQFWKTVFLVEILYLFYFMLHSGALKSDSWLPSGKTQEKRWSQVNQIFQTLIMFKNVWTLSGLSTYIQGVFYWSHPPTVLRMAKAPLKSESGTAIYEVLTLTFTFWGGILPSLILFGDQ